MQGLVLAVELALGSYFDGDEMNAAAGAPARSNWGGRRDGWSVVGWVGRGRERGVG